ncbi:P-loop containing nucleoside triphosphate hydrolase protein [Paraphysoderma sedebokerense]|nr:P-loop containing nucleoside triphosphate hydrolase protein [Paraphysoderma sedebokerense]
MEDEDFMVLTRKLIEVRNILKAVQHNDALRLPSIVVVGSQSSGKSSVLETIVGHEFLPKGNNMVTRRPLELTLIHTPGSNEEYGEFPQLGFGKISNFRTIQKTLVDLNNAVPASECVSDKPIELRIYSPNVPDLTLIDLPGYVQINSKNQPATLKEQIAALCDKYIQEPNIILAVCAADVDLANSEALRASRKVDPLGWRTIGVITKMDLVEPEIGAGILRNSDYPLHLGYVGVVCKPPISARLGSNANHSKAIIKSEESFFSHHPEYKARDIAVGTRKLRRLLMEVLEESMGRRLYSISDAVRTELDETNYQFKVQYNDRRITAESYLAETMDTLKHRFKDFARQFGKPQVRAEVRKMLEQRVVDICEQLYWMDPKVNELGTKAATAEEYYWQNKLTTASSALTKSGVGRSSTQLVVDLLMSNMERLVSTDPFIYHPDARRKVLQLCNEIIRHKFYTTVDQVENTIKPYKFEVECTDLEWVDAAKRTFSLLEREINQSQKLFDAIKANIGRRKLNPAMKYLSDFDSSQSPTSKPPVPLPTLPLPPTDEPSRSSYPDTILHPAREALYHRHRINALKNRLYYLKSRSCKSPDCQIQCPEIFLNCVAEKLTYTAVMFIYVELLNEFFFQVPRDVDGRLYYDLSKQEIQNFSRENQLVSRHLELMERKQSLEMAMEKLGWLIRRQEDLARKRSGERRGQDVDVREGGLRDQ